MVITLMGKNNADLPPTVEDLMWWTEQYDIHHAVVQDHGWGISCSYIDCSDGFGLPSMHLLGPGAEVLAVDTHLDRSYIEQLLQR